MLRNVMRLAIVLSIVLVESCNSNQKALKNPESQLIGEWDLLLRHECENYPIRSDHLTLRADGTFDQHTVLKDGQKIVTLDQHWQYFEKDHIGFNSRRDWELHSDPSLSRDTGPSPAAGTSEHQVLIVHFGSTPEILLNPDSDCVYVKSK